MNWFLKGVKNRIKTEELEGYRVEQPSFLDGKSDYDCPTDALENGKWDMNRCIFCRECDLKPTGKQTTFTVNRETPHIFEKSLYLYPIDSGTCGACYYGCYAQWAIEVSPHEERFQYDPGTQPT